MRWAIPVVAGLLTVWGIHPLAAEEPAWTVRVINEREVDLSGGIDKGISTEFAKVVDANPSLHLVHVNVGGGGSVKEALILAEIIARLKMDTFVPRNCGGSCTIVAAAGVKRYLRSGVKLGYTNYEVPGKGFLDPATWQSLYKTPFPADFIAQGAAARLDQVWAPSPQELLAAGAVTEIVTGETFAASGVAVDAAGIEKDLLELRVFQVIKAREPAQFAALIDKLQGAVAKGMPVEQVRSVSLNWIGGLRAKYIPYADDQAVAAFIQLALDEAETVARQDLAACHAVLSGGAVPGAERAIALMPKELRQQEPAILADIFESADPARPLPDAAHTDALFDQVITRMGADGALLDQASDPSTSPEIGCRVSLSLYRALLTLLPEDSAALFKSWYLS
jgi:hypothetical protein